jgi:tRNA 2-thiouridine synthesizing protein A
MSHTKVDARNMSCPLPILRTRKALNGIGSGETLELIATDPGSMKDIAAFCQQTGNALVSASEHAGEYVFMIRKS